MRRANLLCQGWTKAVSARIMQTEASPFESANTPSRLRRDDYLRKGGDPLTPLNLTDSHKHHQYQRKGCVNHAECFCANYENK